MNLSFFRRYIFPLCAAQIYVMASRQKKKEQQQKTKQNKTKEVVCLVLEIFETTVWLGAAEHCHEQSTDHL